MGLDTYLARISNMGEKLDWGDEVPSGLTADDLELFGALDLPLCEWMVDGDTVSFRGKVYIMVVMEVADDTLVQEWIPPAEVAEIARAFEACDPEAVAGSLAQFRYEVTAREIRALRTLFTACAQRGIGLVGSY
jgi:hypothetical protein